MSDLLGFLKCEVLQAVFDDLLPTSAQVEIEVTNATLVARGGGRLVKVIRTTEAQAGACVSWNECYDVRCGIGWELMLYVRCQSAHGEGVVLITDRLVVANNGSGTYFLRQGDAVRGELRVNLSYYPNHQCFSYLVKESKAEVHVLHHLADVLREMIQQSAVLSADVLHRLTDAMTRMKTLFEQSFEDVAARSLRIPPVSNSDTFSVEQVAVGIRSMLQELTASVPEAPRAYTSTVEKMIVLFGCEEPLSLRDFERLATISALWVFQHAYIFICILNEFDIRLPELVALWKRFSRYDTLLAGDICSDDLEGFLTDLGEEYTQNEVALIARTIDPDRLGLIELPEFVRWWTADRVTA